MADLRVAGRRATFNPRSEGRVDDVEFRSLVDFPRYHGQGRVYSRKEGKS